MLKTIGGKLVRLFAVAVSAAVLCGCAFMFTACSTRRPEISVRISFNGEEYTLNYTLYRDYYRQTVDHYMALIDANFFDNTVIHDYQSDRMVGGGYTYDSMDTSDAVEDLKALDYDGTTLNSDGTVKVITASVWEDAEHTKPTNRLYGEVEASGHIIDNGSGLTNKLGALGTYSYVKSDSDRLMYWNRTKSGAEGSNAYYYNSVTSMFYIYTSSTSTTDKNLCVFGELANEASTTALNDLITAINDYTDALGDNGSFTTEKDVTLTDAYAADGRCDVTFNVPSEKIIIEEISVVKY